jgi:hydrogenase-4 component E
MMAFAPSTYDGVADGLTLLVLLSEFAMLRAAMLRSQVRLYAFQSLVVTVLAVYVAAVHHLGDLYVLAGVTLLLKVIVVPAIVLRLMKASDTDLGGSNRLPVASTVLIAIAVSIFGFFTVGSLPIHSVSLPDAALAISAAVLLVAFVLIILRADVVSQAIGFFTLDNAVSIASLVVAVGLPLVVDVAFLVDLLVAVVVFGVLMRVHHAQESTLSTDVLDRLRG